MPKRASMQSRVFTSVLIGLLFFLAAISLWLYRTGRLGISADVLVSQNQVTMNFDELTTPLPLSGQFTKLGKQYQNYGITFTGESYPRGLFDQTEPTPNVLVFSSAWATANHEPVTPSTPPNAISGTNPTSEIPLPTNGIVLNFNDPANPAVASTTSSVKFTLDMAMPTGSTGPWSGGTNTCGPLGGQPNLSIPCSALWVKATAYSASGTVVATQTFTTTGTHDVSFTSGAVSKVVVSRTDRVLVSGVNGAVTALSAPKFVLDDLTYTMPGSSTAPSVNLSIKSDQAGAGGIGTRQITIKSGQDSQLFWNSLNATACTLASTGGGNTAIGLNATSWTSQGNPTTTTSYTITCTGAGGSASDTATATVGATPPPPPATPTATLSTDKSSYKQGETVNFTFTNTGTVDISCPNVAPYQITDSTGKVVAQQIGAIDPFTLKPSESKSWSWDQKANALNGQQAANGSYIVTVRCSVTSSASFAIVSSNVNGNGLDFDVNPQEGVVPLPVTATYSGSERCLSWDFGDGTVDSNASATDKHTYLTAGTFTVTLRSCTGASGTKQVTVKKSDVTAQGTTLVNTTTASSSGPTVTNTTSDATKTATSPATLVATGGNLAVNLTMAALLSAFLGWLLFRRPRTTR